jgi:hypothetical protein
VPHPTLPTDAALIRWFWLGGWRSGSAAPLHKDLSFLDSLTPSGITWTDGMILSFSLPAGKDPNGPKSPKSFLPGVTNGGDDSGVSKVEFLIYILSVT